MTAREARLLRHTLRAWSAILRTTNPAPIERIARVMDREADKLDNWPPVRDWTPADWDQ